MIVGRRKFSLDFHIRRGFRSAFFMNILSSRRDEPNRSEALDIDEDAFSTAERAQGCLSVVFEGRRMKGDVHTVW